MYRLLVLIVALSVLCLSSDAEKRIALLIGNEDYPASVGQLQNPHQDASMIRDALIASNFDDIILLTDATQSEINLAVAEFAAKLRRAGDEGIGFFYYSGHGGSTESSGVRQNYLIPAKTPITGSEQLPILGVSMGSIIESLSAADAKAVFIVSDACRNTLPFTSSKGGTTDRGFVPIQTRSGLFVAYATADGATAPDDGAFARALASQIRRPGQTASRAFELAFREVASIRAGNRLPFYSPGLTEDICFFGDCGDAISQPASILFDDEATALAQAISLDSYAAYQEYRQKFPGSSNMQFVNARIAQLSPTPKRKASPFTAEHRSRLQTILNAQPSEVRARYDARHPLETLEFFEITPGMNVAEALPGGGWYSKILLQYLGSDGTLLGAHYPNDLWPRFGFGNDWAKTRSDATRYWPEQAREWQVPNRAKIRSEQMTFYPRDLDGTLDAVLFIRALHNLNRFSKSEKNYIEETVAESYRALKPGGVVGVVQHRAPETNSDNWADGSNGYLKQAHVLALFEAAGFTFEGSIEINRNPKDQPTESDFVWRLPPALAGAEEGSAARRRNEAIGESDRMTLKFRKPG